MTMMNWNTELSSDDNNCSYPDWDILLMILSTNCLKIFFCVFNTHSNFQLVISFKKVPYFALSIPTLLATPVTSRGGILFYCLKLRTHHGTRLVQIGANRKHQLLNYRSYLHWTLLERHN